MSALTYRAAVRIVRAEEQATRDKTYRKYPLGQEVGRFLRAKRLEGCRPLTIVSYESVLAKLTLRYADFDSLEPFTERARGPELLLDFLEHYWGDSDEDTRIQRFAVLASFFKWAYRNDRVSGNPMEKVGRPRRRRGRGAARERVPDPHVARLVSAQELIRDQAAMLLLGRLALRRNDLRMLQLGDIDLARDELHLRHGKGGEEATLPIAFRDVREALYLHLQERAGHPDEFLLYPKTHRTRPLSPAGIDQWFQRCVARAGLTGYTMHQLRHAAIDEVRRQTGDAEAARMLARHKNLQTTQDYLHSTVDDLRERLGEMSV